MDITVLTIFPEMFPGFWEHGIIRRAIEGEDISASAVNIRDYAEGRHHVTDDRPYGGGCGMVMKPEPLSAAIRAAREKHPWSRTVLLTPQGRVFDQRAARELSQLDGLIFVCGRYEGVDERIIEDYIDEEISIGDYVLTGGEIAAMAVIDAVVRLIPGVLGGEDSAGKDSFSEDLLEHAHYTRPPHFEGTPVPEVLLSGNHGKIEQWRLESGLIRTFLKRPDLLENRPQNRPQNRPLTREEIDILKRWCREIEAIIQSQTLCGADPPSGGQ